MRSLPPLALALCALLSAGCPTFDFDNGTFACKADKDCDKARGEKCVSEKCVGSGGSDGGKCLDLGTLCTSHGECCSGSCVSNYCIPN